MSELAIAARGLRKVYLSGFFRIPYTGLEGLDLDVRRGEVFGFIGPNGAGKTTTIKVLMGLQHATSGEASLLGVDHRESAARERVGFLPERPYFYQHLTAREFLDFYARLYGMSAADRKRRSGELLERVQLERFADVPMKSYSKGMLQRAGLAQALLHDPDLLVMDEPMSGLDPMGRALIRDILFEERDKGKTVFFSSHILADVELICDRVAVLVKGVLRGCGTIDELVGDRVRHVDIAARVAEDAPLPGLRMREEGGVTQLRVAPDQVDRALAAVHAAGGSIVDVTRARAHLEDFLLDEVDRDRPIDKKKLGVLA